MVPPYSKALFSLQFGITGYSIRSNFCNEETQTKKGLFGILVSSTLQFELESAVYFSEIRAA